MIPPALPIFFSICQTISLIRLSRKNVIGTDPAKLVVASEVSVMCFDKTGTITTDNIEVSGFTDSECKELLTSFSNQGNAFYVIPHLITPILILENK